MTLAELEQLLSRVVDVHINTIHQTGKLLDLILALSERVDKLEKEIERGKVA